MFKSLFIFLPRKPQFYVSGIKESPKNHKQTFLIYFIQHVLESWETLTYSFSDLSKAILDMLVSTGHMEVGPCN